MFGFLCVHLVWVCQQKDLCDGGGGKNGVEGRELRPGGRLQLHGHGLPVGKHNNNDDDDTLFLAERQQGLFPEGETSPPSHLGSRDAEADAGDGGGGRRQHGDDHHQHVGARRRRVAGEVEEDPQAVAVEHGHR